MEQAFVEAISCVNDAMLRDPAKFKNLKPSAKESELIDIAGSQTKKGMLANFAVSGICALGARALLTGKGRKFTYLATFGLFGWNFAKIVGTNGSQLAVNVLTLPDEESLFAVEARKVLREKLPNNKFFLMCEEKRKSSNKFENFLTSSDDNFSEYDFNSNQKDVASYEIKDSSSFEPEVMENDDAIFDHSSNNKNNIFNFGRSSSSEDENNENETDGPPRVTTWEDIRREAAGK